MTTFTCRECSETFPVSFAKKGTVTSIGTGKCKKCHNLYSKRHLIESELKRRPENYRTCNNCDQYYSIKKSNGSMETPENCKFCGSSNTEWVMP